MLCDLLQLVRANELILWQEVESASAGFLYVICQPQDFQEVAEEVQGEAKAAEQGLHRYGALLSQLPPTVRAMVIYHNKDCIALPFCHLHYSKRITLF